MSSRVSRRDFLKLAAASAVIAVLRQPVQAAGAATVMVVEDLGVFERGNFVSIREPPGEHHIETVVWDDSPVYVWSGMGMEMWACAGDSFWNDAHPTWTYVGQVDVEEVTPT